jgi:hypothetical protein
MNNKLLEKMIQRNVKSKHRLKINNIIIKR